MADKKQLEEMFLKMHPGFFEREDVRSVKDGRVCYEMMMYLDGFRGDEYRKELPGGVSFDFLPGTTDELMTAVGKVVPSWLKLYEEGSRIYCGFLDGRIASFCMVHGMGEYVLDGKPVKVGGPGCVGTVPEYRNLGIGLTMVRNATEILKSEGFDIGYIHYTEVPGWYSKIGYETVLTWNAGGFV